MQVEGRVLVGGLGPVGVPNTLRAHRGTGLLVYLDAHKSVYQGATKEGYSSHLLLSGPLREKVSVPDVVDVDVLGEVAVMRILGAQACTARARELGSDFGSDSGRSCGSLRRSLAILHFHSFGGWPFAFAGLWAFLVPFALGGHVGRDTLGWGCVADNR